MNDTEEKEDVTDLTQITEQSSKQTGSEQKGSVPENKEKKVHNRRGSMFSILLIVNLILILCLAMFTIITSARVNGLYDSLNELGKIVTVGKIFNTEEESGETAQAESLVKTQPSDNVEPGKT